MGKRRVSKILVLAMLAGVMLVSLLFFVRSSPSLSSWFASVPSQFSLPINRTLSAPRRWLGQQIEELHDLMATYEENKALKKKLFDLSTESQDIEDLEKENASLRQQLQLKNELSSVSVQGTEILNRSRQSWLELVTVDKGKDDGIRHADLLLSEGAVVGRVNQVDKASSQVVLLTQTSGKTGLAIKIGQDEQAIYGMLLGYDSKKKVLRLGHFNEQKDLSPGIEVVTSGYDGAVANLPVGQVLSVEHESDQSLIVYASPKADFEHLDLLTLVGRLSDD